MLYIDTNTTTDIKKIIAYANKHIFDKYQIKLLLAGDIRPPGDNPEFIIYIEKGYRVVYSIEAQNMGLCHHISISNKGKKGLYDIKGILEAFNLSSDFDKYLSIWEEDKDAINFLIQK